MTAVYSPSITGSTGVTVLGAVLDALAVTPVDPSVPAGEDLAFRATGTYSDGSSRDLSSSVTWTSSDLAVATVDSTGLAHAVDVGTSTITATSGTVSASSSLTVTEPEISYVTLTPDGADVPVGLTRQYTATATLTDGTTEDITDEVAWATDEVGTATIDADGLLTAVALGDTVVRAQTSSSDPDGVFGAYTSVHVVDPVLTDLTADPTALSLPRGLDSAVLLTATYSDGTTTDVSSLATWTSDDPAVAGVDPTGLVHAVELGSTTVRGAYGGREATTAVTVGTAVLRSLEVRLAPDVYRGASQQARALGRFSDGTSADLTRSVQWRSLNTSRARVDAAGVVAGRAPGTLRVVARSGGLQAGRTLQVLATTVRLDSMSRSAGPPGAVVALRGVGLGRRCQAVALAGRPVHVISQTATQIRVRPSASCAAVR